jgi:hypothetical protein
MPAGSLLSQFHTSVLLNIKQTQLHNKWHYTYISGTCNMQQVTNCYIHTYTHTHTHKISKTQTCILSLSVKQCSSLVILFFMNVKISLPIICYNVKIYVLLSNLMALCHKPIAVVTWTLTQNVPTGHQVSWLQEV